jgi:hypothetical protein
VSPVPFSLCCVKDVTLLDSTDNDQSLSVQGVLFIIRGKTRVEENIYYI